MLHQRAAFDALRERPAVGLAPAPFLWLETVQLPAMPDQRSNAEQPAIVREITPSNRASCKYPRVNAVCIPGLCQFLPRILEPQPFSEFLRFVTLPGLNSSQLAQLLVKPLLADLQR